MNKATKSKILFILCILLIIGTGIVAGSIFSKEKDEPESESTVISDYSSSSSVTLDSSFFSEKETITEEQTENVSTTEKIETAVKKTTEKETEPTKKQTEKQTYITDEPKTKKHFTIFNKPIEKTTSAITTTKKVVSTRPTTAPVSETSDEIDYSCFDNCAFLGNSRVLALKTYGLVKNVYASVGLTVDTVFTQNSSNGIPVIDELNGKDFEKIFIMFGDNECGWPNPDVFIERYVKVINAVKSRLPDTVIYIQSILPVSQYTDETSKYGCTNANINIFNEKIKTMTAEQNVIFIEPAIALRNSEGKLPDEASSDGIHLNKKYCKKWLNYLAENM